ncbi:TPA: hypothetical protein NV436_005896 [Pseudomonas aeruginosa]|nr:hypothetical protein [Pseudomonas aeruginosa]
MNKANECTCPSGDGSLVHPCPAHPAVEQAGGGERAAFELFVRKHCGMPAHIAVNWDAKFTNDAWEGWKARAALAQPSPVQAEQAEGAHVPDEVFAGVFAEWWEEEGQYCRAGGGDYERTFAFQAWRHLYPLLLQARAALAQPSPAHELDPLGLAPHAEAFNEAPDEALRPEQAEAERSALWAVHAQGPDELYAAFSREDAEKHAAELNALPMPEGIAVGAVVVPSPWPAVQHWQYLAEQEQDHKNEITGRLRQLERICEGLPQDAIDGGWTVQGIRGYAKRLEDQLKAAQAEVEALRAELQSQRERNTELIFKLGSATNGWGRCEKERDAALARVAELESKLAELEKQEPVALANRGNQGFWVEWTEAAAGLYGSGIKLYAATVAQAQHSVPEGWMLVECGIWTQEQVDEMQKTVTRFRNSEFVDDRALAMAVADAGQCKAPEISLAELLAAAPGKEVGHE